MDNRFSGLIVTAAIAAAASAAISVSVTGTSAQAPPVPGAAQKPPASKTAWGEPDLQGIWTDETETPLQRPAKYANQEFFTEAQRAELDRVRSDIVTRRATDVNANNGYNGAVFFSMKRTGVRTSKIADPPNGRMPPLTPAAQKATAADRDFRLALIQSTDTCKKGLAGCAGWKYDPATSPRRAEVAPRYITRAMNRNDGPEDSSLGERCLTGSPLDFGGNTGNFRRIVQTPGGITMFYDVGQGQGWQRNIDMNGGPHLPANIRQWFGDSRGHWEGDTLVVDVTNFTPKTDFQGSRENLHLVERWTRTGPMTLAYEVTIEDPTAWTRPWTVKQEFSRQSDEENRLYAEPRCIEGNEGLPGLLHGRRVEDLAFAEGRGPDPASTDTTANFASTVVLEDPLQQ
jgi:hypothetical protein